MSPKAARMASTRPTKAGRVVCRERCPKVGDGFAARICSSLPKTILLPFVGREGDMKPKVEQLDLPEGYGNPSSLLHWDAVRRELEEAPQYWVATTRPDGRPHVVPRDGIWLDDTWFYGGSPETVHNRNVEHNSEAVMHIGDGAKAIIVEGEVKHIIPERDFADRLADASNNKYSHYGLNLTADTYVANGTWALKARRVLAWTNLPENATRFRF